MKRQYRVFGDAVVTVSCVVELDEKTSDQLSAAELEQELYKRARSKFEGIRAYLGNGGDSKLIGVEGDKETIAADAPVEWADYQKGL